jgi:hypothetical protein
MPLILRVMMIVAATSVLVLGLGVLVRRALGPSVQSQLILIVARLLLTVGLALAVGFGATRDRGVLVFAVGVTYFAIVLGQAFREAGRTRRSSASRSTRGVSEAREGAP